MLGQSAGQGSICPKRFDHTQQELPKMKLGWRGFSANNMQTIVKIWRMALEIIVQTCRLHAVSGLLFLLFVRKAAHRMICAYAPSWRAAFFFFSARSVCDTAEARNICACINFIDPRKPSRAYTGGSLPRHRPPQRKLQTGCP